MSPENEEGNFNRRRGDELLYRLDERTTAVHKAIQEIKHTLEKKYVTQDEFRPIKVIVYGLVGTMLTGVAGAIISLVVQK